MLVHYSDIRLMVGRYLKNVRLFVGARPFRFAAAIALAIIAAFIYWNNRLSFTEPGDKTIGSVSADKNLPFAKTNNRNASIKPPPNTAMGSGQNPTDFCTEQRAIWERGAEVLKEHRFELFAQPEFQVATREHRLGYQYQPYAIYDVATIKQLAANGDPLADMQVLLDKVWGSNYFKFRQQNRVKEAESIKHSLLQLEEHALSGQRRIWLVLAHTYLMAFHHANELGDVEMAAYFANHTKLWLDAAFAFGDIPLRALAFRYLTESDSKYARIRPYLQKTKNNENDQIMLQLATQFGTAESIPLDDIEALVALEKHTLKMDEGKCQ